MVMMSFIVIKVISSKVSSKTNKLFLTVIYIVFVVITVDVILDVTKKHLQVDGGKTI